MSKIGYARISTHVQNDAAQLQHLEDAKCDQIFVEQIGGKIKNRPEFNRVMRDVLREGDILIATRIDRIARSNLHLLEIIADLQKRGIGLMLTEQPISTEGPTGKLMIGILGAVAEFETDLRDERVMEGIRQAQDDVKNGKRTWKRRGQSEKHKGINWDAVKVRIDAGEPKTEIYRSLDMSESTFYRELKKHS